MTKAPPPPAPPTRSPVRLRLDDAELRRGWRYKENLRIIEQLRAAGARVRIISAREAVVE